jgi:ATP-binding cassette, subfamily B, bacterial
VSPTEETKKEERKPKFREVARAAWRMLKWGRSVSPYALPSMFIFLMIVSVLPFGTSYLDSRVIDEIVRLLGLPQEQRGLATFTTLIVLVVAANILERSIWICIAYAEKMNFFNISRTVTLKFLRKASELDVYHYENSESNDVIQKAKDTYTWKPAAFLSRSIYMIGDVIRILASVIIILSFSFPAFVFVLLTTVPSLIVNLKLSEGSWGIWSGNATDRRRFFRSADLLTRENSLMELRIFRSRRYLLNVVEEIYNRFTDKERKAELRRTFLESLVGNLSTLGTMAFWVFAIVATLNGEITLGLLTFYTSSLTRFSEALNSLFRQLSDHYEDGLYLVDLFKFIDLENVVTSGTLQVDSANRAPLIVFRNVDFKYPDTDKYVLKNFNLVIEPGEHVALVGANGAGKTTIIKLLSRFYDVTEGQILINGVDIRELDMDSWYDQVGVLFQDFIKYGQFDVRTNVGLGRVDNIEDMNGLQNAIFKADAKAFIEEYEHQLEQVLDKSFDNGTNPSEGQWQRIALARAFFRDAPILVLDEPTSAIDAKAEQEIFERLYEFSQDKSLIIISHRFSTVRNADKIYVIDDGQVAECGSHDDLIRLDGKYKEAFSAQAKGYQ